MRLLFIAFLTFAVAPGARAQQRGTIEHKQIHSAALEMNILGVSSTRSVSIYLPPDYTHSSRAYPVVYYFHNYYFSADRLFNETRMLHLIDRAWSTKVVDEFILVAADFSTDQMGSLYENSPVSGRWLDFITQELVPFIDRDYRTIPHRDSRAAVGDFFGGRGALKLGMSYANQFGVVYALHPVAAGNGPVPWFALDIDWKAISSARTYNELAGKGRTQIFVAVCQAFLPHPGKPPFHCDFFMEVNNGVATLIPSKVRQAQKEFLLDETLDESAENLRSLRGLAFDWGRFDLTQAHVESNREFSRKLGDLGVEHQAEEYAGGPFDKVWLDDGRFYSRVLPFIQAHLKFK